MVDRVLFPTDGSAGAMATLEHALDLATDHDAVVHLLTVENGGSEEDVLALAAERVRERGLEPTSVRREGRPYREILRYAEEAAVDLIVMPTHGRTGLERLLLGSVTARVLRLADPPVLTARPGAELRYPYRRLLVPTDGSRCAEAALEVGIELARTAEVPLDLLSVVETTRTDVNVRSSVGQDRIADRARSAVQAGAERAREAGLPAVSTTVTRGPSVPDAISDHVAQEQADLIVLGTHGRTGLDRYLFGGTTEQLVRTATVPVVTVREPDSET